MPKVKKSTATKTTPRLDYAKLKSYSILGYDFDNIYPNRVEDIVADSGTANSCLKMHRKFVLGKTTQNEEFDRQKINSKNMTIRQLRRKMVKSLGVHRAIAVHFNYNGLGQKVSIQYIPWKFIRIGLEGTDKEGMYCIYDNWDAKKGKIEPKSFKWVYPHNPKKVLEEVDRQEGETLAEQFANYTGQLYVWTENGADQYTECPFDSVLEDMQTEGQAKRFRFNTVSSNFTASHLLITGKSNSNEEAEEFDKSVQEFSGGDAEGTAKMLVLEKESDSDTFELKKIELQDYDGMYEYTSKESKDSIREQFLIPSILLFRGERTFGSSKEMSEAYDSYNAITEDDRQLISDILEEICAGFYRELNNTGDYGIVPIRFSKPITSEYFPYYTKNEIRKANGDVEIKDVESEVTPLAVTLGVGGTQALKDVLTDTTLDNNQKKGVLKVLFNLSDEDILTMIGI